LAGKLPARDPGLYVRIGELRIGQSIRGQLEKLGSEMYLAENAGTGDQALLAKIDREERLITGQLLHREYLAVHDDKPGRLEDEDRRPRFSGRAPRDPKYD
jgi:hypothetical protein